MAREAYHCNRLAFAKKNAISVSEMRPYSFAVVVILVFFPHSISSIPCPVPLLLNFDSNTVYFQHFVSLTIRLLGDCQIWQCSTLKIHDADIRVCAAQLPPKTL